MVRSMHLIRSASDTDVKRSAQADETAKTSPLPEPFLYTCGAPFKHEDSMCAICRTVPNRGETLFLGCGHSFCRTCLKMEAKYRGKCPTCRMPHLLEPDELKERWSLWRQQYRAWRMKNARGSKGTLGSVRSPLQLGINTKQRKKHFAANDDSCEKTPRGLFDSESVVLLVVLPTLDMLRLAYMYTALPLHYLDMGWNTEILGILFTLFFVMRLPINWFLTYSGVWLSVPFLVVDFALTIAMVAQPDSKWVVFASCLFAQGTKMIQAYKQLAFQKFAGQPKLHMRAMKMLTTCEVVGYSAGTFFGGLLYDMGSWSACAVYQSAITIAMVLLTAWLPSVRQDFKSKSRCCCASKETVAPSRHDEDGDAQKGDGARIPKELLFPIGVLLAAEAVNVFSYTSEWSLYAIYFREQFGWSSTWIGVAQSGGDILAAIFLFASSCKEGSKRKGSRSSCFAALPISIYVPLFASGLFHFCLATNSFEAALVGQVLMGTSYVVCSQGLQEMYIALCKGSKRMYDKVMLFSTYAFNIGAAPTGAMSLALYAHSRSAAFHLSGSINVAVAAMLFLYFSTSSRSAMWKNSPQVREQEAAALAAVAAV